MIILVVNNLHSEDNREFWELDGKGSEAFDNYLIDDALALFNEASTKEMNEECKMFSNYVIGKCYFELKKYKKSLEYFNDVNPDFSFRAIHYRAKIYKILDDIAKVNIELKMIKDYIRKASTEQRITAMPYIMEGLILYELGNTDDALISIDKAFTNKGGDRTFTYLFKAIFLYDKSEYKDALSALEDCYKSEKYPDLDLVEYKLWKSIILYNNDMIAKAIKNYQDAILYNRSLPSKDIDINEIISLRGFYLTLPEKAIKDLDSIEKLVKTQEL